MSAFQNQNKMIQIDAFKTPEEIMEDNICEKLKENFTHRINFLFYSLEDLNKSYDSIMKQCTFLYEEIEAAKHVFISSHIRMKSLELEVEALK